MTTTDTTRRYEAAKKLAADLQAKTDRARGRLEAAKKQYSDLVTKAKADYQVESLSDLEALAGRIEAENAAALDKFDTEAAALKAELARVEQALELANV